MPTIWINCSLLTYVFNNRVSNSRIPNYEFYNSDGKINETILKVKFFVFLRHSSFLDRYSITITQATQIANFVERTFRPRRYTLPFA